MIRIGIIGAGNISKSHLNAAKSVPDVTITYVCNRNPESAKARAEEFGVPDYCCDYHDILNDPNVDAVLIATPTVSHGPIIADALRAGKHVLCEKPPALTWQEALECERLAKETGKVLMYAFVCRFQNATMAVKKAIDNGELGEIYYADASRMQRCSTINGWFCDKELAGGGCLMDAAIHQLDMMLYFMGFPKVLRVRGYTTNINKDLPKRIQGVTAGWVSANGQPTERTIESFATGYITLEGGKNIFIKAAHIANTFTPGTRLEILGDKGGANITDGVVKLLGIDETNHFVETQPTVTATVSPFVPQLQHFADCCNGKTQCLCPPDQGTQVMRIMNAIYESAQTGKEISFA